MATLAPLPKFQAFDANGDPLVGGKLYTYAAGTTTPQATYTDEGGATPNANPVILDANGQADVWLGALAYKFILKDAADVTQWTVDDIQSDLAIAKAYTDTLRSDLASTSDAAKGDDLIGVKNTNDGGVARTQHDKNQEFVSVTDFGAVGDGVTDDTVAIQKAIAASHAVYFPKPSVSYLVGSNIQITKPVRLFGDNTSGSLIERGYSPTNDADGIFAFKDGSTAGRLEDLFLRSKTGQTGGCLVSIVCTASGNIGDYVFKGCRFSTTGTSTHNYTVYMDGTAQVVAPIGIRAVDFFACQVFGGATSTMLVKGVLKFSFIGGGVYTAGGAGTSNINFTGTGTVQTQSFVFSPADCSCPIAFDYATLGIVSCGVLGAVTNTANTSYITGCGYTASVQTNWSNSQWNYPDADDFLAVTNANLTNVTGDNTNYTVLFQTVVYDKNSCFNTGTGVFTCKRPGTYLFDWCVAYASLAAGHTRHDTGITHKNSVAVLQNSVVRVSNPVAGAASGNYSEGGCVQLKLAVGDTVVVNANVSGSTKTVGITGAAGTRYSWFGAKFLG